LTTHAPAADTTVSATDPDDVPDTSEVRRHPLCGPLDRMPVRYRGPHRLAHAAWLGFTGRLERREEIAFVRAATAANQRVLDVGGGTGELTRAIASQVGRCTTVEPHGSRVATLNERADDGHTGSIEIIPGQAESLPFPDRAFDAVLAAWVLPYVDDLEGSVREMARVCDVEHPQARVVLLGGAPDNELVRLLNETCVPLADEPHDHQGFLLATAAEILARHGFRHFSLHRTEAALHFPEIAPRERVRVAATTLVDLWYEDHPRAGDMREAITPALHHHFARRPHAIGDQGVALIARPGTP